jgi:Plasmid replication protein.
MTQRSRKVSLVCYTEPTIQQLSGAIRWAYILHDKDINIDKETGEIIPKKNHYHVYMEFGNARYLSSIAKEYDLPEAAINKVANTKSTLAYLTHRTQKAISDNKFLYDSSEVVFSDDMEFDFDEIVDSAESVDWLKIFNMPTLQDAIIEYKKQGEQLNSLQQFKNFVQTFHTMKQIEKEAYFTME